MVYADLKNMGVTRGFECIGYDDSEPVYKEEDDLLDYQFEGNKIYHLFVDLIIGIVGMDGGQLFQVHIYNSNAIRKYKIMLAYESLILNFDNYATLEQELKKLIGTLSGNDWDDLCAKLRKHFSWEYEDHHFG